MREPVSKRDGVMERGRILASNVFRAALLLLVAMPAAAQVGEGTRSLYTQRFASNAAGLFSGFAGSPPVGVGTVPVLETVVTWDKLRRDNYLGSFAEYALFLRGNPDWPQLLSIRRQAEKTIDEAVAAPDRIAYFKQFPPLSAVSRLRLAEALMSVGRGAEARAMASDAWDSAGLDQTAETQLLAQFESALTPADHLARADRLLWSGQTTSAARLISRMDPDHLQWLLARIALRTNSSDVASRLAAVPPALRNDAGLTIDRALWMRRIGDVSGAQALLANSSVAPGQVVDPESWLKTRLEFGRQAWRSGNFDTAYRILARHNAFAPGRPVADRPLAERQVYIDSEWLAGWLSLRKLAQPARAMTHFQNARAAALTPLSQTRGDYWTGRAAEAAGRSDDANIAYGLAAVHFDYFYGQLAAEQLGRPLAIKRAPAPAIPAGASSSFRADPLVRAATALGDIGDRTRQTIFLRWLADRADNPVQQALVAGLAKPLDRPDVGVYAGKAARSDGQLSLLDAAFPILDLPASLGSQFTVIHAISRQESQFDRGVISDANARGLMQLLPGTAAEQAGKLGLPASTDRLTSDPIYNVTLGSAYFARLRDNFAGSYVLAVAGYNAGPGNVRKFLAANGDPRDPGMDVVDWIEAIPLSETRNYVQRVLENAVVYDLLHPATAVMPTTNRLSAYLGKRTPG